MQMQAQKNQSLDGARRMLNVMATLRVVPSPDALDSIKQDLREMLRGEGRNPAQSIAVRAIGAAAMGMLPSEAICREGAREVDGLIHAQRVHERAGSAAPRQR